MLGSCLGQALTDTRSKEEVVLRAGVGLLERRGERADRFLSFLNTALDPECTPRLARPPPPPQHHLGARLANPTSKSLNSSRCFSIVCLELSCPRKPEKCTPYPLPVAAMLRGKCVYWAPCMPLSLVLSLANVLWA